MLFKALSTKLANFYSTLKGDNMTIYKVIDEQNQLVYAFKSLEVAQQEVDMLNESQANHHFFIEPVEVEQIT